MHMNGKQKLNTSGGATCELAWADDVSQKILWMPLFLKGQGHKTASDEACQDDALAILFEENWRKIARERTQALNVWCFVITDHMSGGNFKICHFSMDEMVADCHTEPPQGKKFMEFHRKTMGFAQCTNKQCIVHRSVLEE